MGCSSFNQNCMLKAIIFCYFKFCIAILVGKRVANNDLSFIFRTNKTSKIP